MPDFESDWGGSSEDTSELSGSIKKSGQCRGCVIDLLISEGGICSLELNFRCSKRQVVAVHPMKACGAVEVELHSLLT